MGGKSLKGRLRDLQRLLEKKGESLSEEQKESIRAKINDINSQKEAKAVIKVKPPKEKLKELQADCRRLKIRLQKLNRDHVPHSDPKFKVIQYKLLRKQESLKKIKAKVEETKPSSPKPTVKKTAAQGETKYTETHLGSLSDEDDVGCSDSDGSDSEGSDSDAKEESKSALKSLVSKVKKSTTKEQELDSEAETLAEEEEYIDSETEEAQQRLQMALQEEACKPTATVLSFFDIVEEDTEETPQPMFNHSWEQRGFGQPRGGNFGRHQSRGGFGDGEGYGQSRGGFGQSRGGYGQSRGGFGQSRGGFGQSRGGFGQSRGGFGQSRGGFGQSRGGFGQSRGGFGQSRGGFGRGGQKGNY